jgi:hypothetical protein
MIRKLAMAARSAGGVYMMRFNISNQLLSERSFEHV